MGLSDVGLPPPEMFMQRGGEGPEEHRRETRDERQVSNASLGITTAYLDDGGECGAVEDEA